MELTFARVANPTCKDYPLPEIYFMRLSQWQKCDRLVSLPGGEAFDGLIFQRYNLRGIRDITLDFRSSGEKISASSMASFKSILSHSHILDTGELRSIYEILVRYSDLIKFENDLQRVEVGSLNGRNVLAIRWIHTGKQLGLVSLYFEANDQPGIVREIHLCVPRNYFEVVQTHLTEVLLSIQWASTAV